MIQQKIFEIVKLLTQYKSCYKNRLLQLGSKTQKCDILEIELIQNIYKINKKYSPIKKIVIIWRLVNN